MKNQSQLASSKMMMALHKKCNSIATSSVSALPLSGINSRGPKNPNMSSVLSQERASKEE